MEIDAAEEGAVSLYLDLKPNELVDLEVAALAAIEWSRAIKAASLAIDPRFDYRVNLIAAEPGSSKWLAKVERSVINQIAKDIQTTWHSVPLILRVTVSLAVVIPITAKPTYEYWFGEKGFTETQIEQLEEAFQKAVADPAVRTHQRAMYREVQRDRNITGLGGGVPDKPDWRPREMIPVRRFAEADGLFDIQEPPTEDTRTISKTLDVILVTPRLENARRSWTFRQEGIPGSFNAEMKDVRFLTGLEQSAIRETLRANIPMRIRLEIKEERVNGEWKVSRRGRSVVEVISPAPDPAVLPARNTMKQ